MSQPFIGEIRLFSFAWAPEDHALCAGSTLPIAQNAALFSLIGTTYGGNGTTSFQVPDLRGRVVMAQGQGSGLTNRTAGQAAGVESVTLAATQVPQVAHTHPFTQTAATIPNSKTPTGKVPGPASSNLYGDPGAASLSGGTVGASTGSSPSQPVGVLQPYLVMNYCIALAGLFPMQP